MNIKELIKKRFGDEMSGYVYTDHEDIENFAIEVWNKAIEAAAENAYMKVHHNKSTGDIVQYDIDKQSILKLKK